jgi:RNA polymerase sigma-70 factor (ECF subfamily)
MRPLPSTGFAMSEQDSFAFLMGRLNAGDGGAADALFRRYAQRLLALARSRLEEAVRRKEDPEDVMQSVFKSFFTRQQDGQFDLAGWDSLWTLLALLTVRKCADRVEYFRAACRDVRREEGAAAGSGPLLRAAADDPTPSEAAILTETLEQLMAGLDGSDRDVVSLQLQGYTIPEISTRVRRSERTVCRVLERARKRLRRLREQDHAG